MNYLISKLNCFVLELKLKIDANAKYKIENLENEFYTFIVNGKPIYVNFLENSKYITKIDYLGDVFFFLFYENQLNAVQTIKCNNSEILISYGDRLKLFIDGVVAVDFENLNFEFSHQENFNAYTILYFEGRRKFFVLLKGREVCAYDFFDEINKGENEIYFMAKLFDSLNHGRVYHIEKGEFSSYLVYLDEFELNLKPEFCVLVFMDCLLAKNYKYCANLLDEKIRPSDEKLIKDFFADFDCFYPLKQNAVALFKKNALAGIYEFEVENLLITNIVCVR